MAGHERAGGKERAGRGLACGEEEEERYELGHSWARATRPRRRQRGAKGLGCACERGAARDGSTGSREQGGGVPYLAGKMDGHGGRGQRGAERGVAARRAR